MSISNVTIRQATREDIECYLEQHQKFTIKAMVGELDGEIIAFGGAVLHKGRWLGFFDLTEKSRPYRMHIMRGAKRFLAMMRKDGVKYIYVEAEPTEPKAKMWLHSLGFEQDPRTQHLYRWKA